jgi:hypothetical protein
MILKIEIVKIFVLKFVVFCLNQNGKNKGLQTIIITE